MLSLKAINDKLIIRRVRSDNKTPAGIIIPNKGNKVHRFQIISVGETVDKYLPGLSVGDFVIADERYANFLDTEVDDNLGTLDYYSIRCMDIMAPIADE